MYIAQVKVDNKRVMQQIRQLTVWFPSLTWVDGTKVTTPLSQMRFDEAYALTNRTCYLRVSRRAISTDFWLDYRTDEQMTFGDPFYGEVLKLSDVADIRKELTA